MNYKGILFDLDGTLVDSFPGIHQSLARTMAALKLHPWDLETTQRNVGHGIEHLLASAVGEARVVEALPLYRADYETTCLEQTFLLPSVYDSLEQLHRRGRKLAVATNKSLPFTQAILEHLEILRFFSVVHGPESVPRPKPHPDMVRSILKLLEVSPDQALYVGDMPLDVETASRAGIACVLVATGATSLSLLREQVSVPVVPNLAALLPLIED